LTIPFNFDMKLFWIEPIKFLKTGLLIFFISFLACSPDEGEETLEMEEMEMEEIKDSNVHLITNSYFKLDEDRLLFDTIDNRLFLFDDENRSTIIAYDYINHQIINEQEVENQLRDNNVGLGRYNDELEIYFGNGNFIDVYNSETLVRRTRFYAGKASTGTEDKYISTIQFEEPNLIFIGACNSGNTNNGTMSFNLDTEELIDEASFGEHCISSMSFRYPNSEEIGLVSISYSTNRTKLILDKFDQFGNILENKILNDVDNVASWSLIRDGNAEYFITDFAGHIVSKNDFSHLGTLIPRFSDDIITNHDGSEIMTLERNELNKYSYPTLAGIDKINFREITDQHTRLKPRRFFIDDGKYYIICYDSEEAYVVEHVIQ